MKKIEYTLILILGCFLTVKGQDIHHTLIDLTPSNKNAALVGYDRSTTYFALLHRNQNYAVVPNVFLRNSLIVDQNFKKYWGIGLNLHHTQTGNVGVRYNSAQAILARHFPLTNQFTMSIASRFGVGKFKKHNESDFISENTILGNSNTETFENSNLLSYRIGLATNAAYRYKQVNISLGYDLRYNQLSSLSQSDYIGDNQWLNMIHFNVNGPLYRQSQWQFGVFYQKLMQQYELQLQALLKSKLNKNDFQLLYGLGWRYGESIQFLLGMQYKELSVMLAYDHNRSKLAQAARGVGALELGATYSIRKTQPKLRKKKQLPIVPFAFQPNSFNTEIEMVYTEPIKESHLSDTKIDIVIKPINIDITTDTLHIYGKDWDTVVVWTNKDLMLELPTDENITITSTTFKTEEVLFINDLDEPKEVKLYPKDIQFDPIYYDFDLSITNKNQEHPLEHITRIMSKYPNLHIELTSYTDQRGSIEYNMQLSKRRAQFAKNYLIDQGIPADRISFQYFGEEHPIIDCKTKNCTESEHQLNRRTEVLGKW